jgi:hypothetical protein
MHSEKKAENIRSVGDLAAYKRVVDKKWAGRAKMLLKGRLGKNEDVGEAKEKRSSEVTEAPSQIAPNAAGRLTQARKPPNIVTCNVQLPQASVPGVELEGAMENVRNLS